MRLCIFSGTFNPIHNAHLRMAEYALSNFNFDKIVFIPAYKPPHKNYDSNMSYHRLKMVELATKYNPKFEVSDIEFQNEGKSYTYSTILKLYEKYNVDGKINMIIGTDAFEKIRSWYQSEKLKNLVKFIVFRRENERRDFLDLKNEGYDFVFTKMNFYDVSSTELRERIKNGKLISNIVRKEVKEYIEEYGLYKY